MCSALSIFADVTGWLAEDLSLDRTEDEGGRVELTKKWISTAKSIMKMLEDTEAAYTTYEESLGMESDQSVSSLFLNIKDGKNVEKPYFPDVLRQAADILFENGEFELAQRCALVAAIDALWDPYRYEKADAFEALMAIPHNLEAQEKYDASANYIIKMLKWLYEFYSTWGLQEAADLYITMLQYELINRWDKISRRTRKEVVDFWKEVVQIVVLQFKHWVVFDDYLMSNLIETIAKSNMYDEAFEIVEARIAALATHGSAIPRLSKSRIEALLQNLQILAKLGFNLKDRKIRSLKKNLNLLKSKYLEDKVSKLASYMGYSEKGARVWKFENQILHKFMGNKKTNTVEIDVHQYKTEHIKGKERKILFLAECKYRNKPATAKDVEFFLLKAKDLLMHEKNSAMRYPEKLTPKIGGLWFVSVNGFRKYALEGTPKIDRSQLRRLNIIELNEMLKKNNLRIVPTV